MGALPRLSFQSGLYRFAAVSGALTTVAAGNATAGHVFAFRNTSPSAIAVIRALRLRWNQQVAFAAPQEMGFALFKLSAYSAQHTGGLGFTPSQSMRKNSLGPTSVVANISIGTTGALTAGTHTFDSNVASAFYFWVAGVGNDAVWESNIIPDDVTQQLFTLRQNEGFIIRNEVLMAAGGVGRLCVEVDWTE